MVSINSLKNAPASLTGLNYVKLEKLVSEKMKFACVKMLPIQFGNAPFNILNAEGISQTSEDESLVRTCL